MPSSGSEVVETPPEPVNLMKEAPRRSSSRTVLRTASTPSTTQPMGLAKQQPQATRSSFAGWLSCRWRISKCPPVWLSARPQKYRRGLVSRPCSIASARPQSAPAVSRSEVKPRSRQSRSMAAAWCASMVMGWR